MFYPPNNKAPIIIRKISATGSTNQATKTKVPKTITPIKEIEPITTVTDLMPVSYTHLTLPTSDLV